MRCARLLVVSLIVVCVSGVVGGRSCLPLPARWVPAAAVRAAAALAAKAELRLTAPARPVLTEQASGLLLQSALFGCAALFFGPKDTLLAVGRRGLICSTDVQGACDAAAARGCFAYCVSHTDAPHTYDRVCVLPPGLLRCLRTLACVRVCVASVGGCCRRCRASAMAAFLGCFVLCLSCLPMYGPFSFQRPAGEGLALCAPYQSGELPKTLRQTLCGATRLRTTL